MKKTKLFLTLFALLAFGPTAWAQLTGSGTSSDPYLITSTEDWNTFAASVNNGTETYYGKTVKLNADIPPVSTMVGNSTENSFQGTFNGDGHTITFNKGTAEAPFDEDFCAPFRYIRSATIKNLHTTGTIYTSGKRAGGIVATATFPFGCSLSSCRSSMTIHGTKNDYGGLVAHVNFENFSYSRNFNITNCLFDGTLVDDGSSEKWGGFIGWVTCEHYTDARLNITNCLFNPVDVPSVSGCKTFVRYGCEDKYIVITNCYYKMTLGDDAQGTTDASDMNNATLLANLGSGWEIVTENNVEMVVPFVPSLRPFTGGAGTEESPYQIASDTDWDNLAYNVSTCEENYSGKYFILMNNIDVSTMIGKGTTSDTDNIPFCGTFDGNGHKLTVTYTNNTVQHTAPFRFAKDVTIKNLHVAGTITTNQQRAGGIIANAQGTIAITNCVSSVIINSSVSGDGTSGGFVATIRNNGNVTIDGCAFVGKLLGSNTTNCGGFVGHTRTNDNAYLTVRNSLFDPEQTTMSGGCATFSRTHSNPGDKLSINNCYYTQSFGTEQGKQADTITSANNNVSLAFAGNPSSNTTLGVIGYGTGIKYNNVLYAGGGDEVSLSLSVPMGMVISSATYTPDGGSATAMSQTENVYSLPMPDANVTINAETGYWVNGSGTAADPFQIATTDDFDMLSTLVRELPKGHPFRPYDESDLIFYGYYFKLMNDLDYTNKTFTPVGYYSLAEEIYRGFRGTFDGQGHVIKGINYETTTGAAGIFGFATGDISNLALINSNLTGGNNTGGIVGYYNGGTISNCHVASNVNIYTPTGSTIVAFHGGIVGRKYAGIISYCTSAAHIVDGCTTYGNHFGGIAGSNDSQSINHCLFTNDIVTSVYTDNKGPIAGSGNGTLTNCYWTNSSFEGSSPSTNYDNSGFINTIDTLQSRMTVSTYSDDFKALAPDGYTLQKTISAWTEDPVTGAGGWYLIASPVVGNIAPEAVVNLLGSQMAGSSQYDFDLYRFNQNANKEWENYKNSTHTAGFVLENGKGYLYARSADTTLTFTGTFNTNNEKVVNLTYDPNSPHSDTRGWNLVGNPFPVEAYVDRPFYKMNEEGSGIEPVDNYYNGYTPITIPSCTGIMVQTTADEVEHETNKVTFSTSMPAQQATNNGNLQIALSQSNTRGNALLDNAIVSFNESSKLGKFYFGEQNANIYLPQNGKDYAIAYSNKQGEMPLNFKAKENSTYTLTVNPEGVEMAYLHLIDNMTGADVDLLATPNYTFTASTTDYASRFKLVFVCGNANDDPAASFAFIDASGNIIITTDAGDATLQVIDVMGRMVASVSGHTRCVPTAGMTPGVYVLRLIDGNNVRTQKVVVE